MGQSVEQIARAEADIEDDMRTVRTRFGEDDLPINLSVLANDRSIVIGRVTTYLALALVRRG